MLYKKNLFSHLDCSTPKRRTRTKSAASTWEIFIPETFFKKETFLQLQGSLFNGPLPGERPRPITGAVLADGEHENRQEKPFSIFIYNRWFPIRYFILPQIHQGYEGQLHFGQGPVLRGERLEGNGPHNVQILRKCNINSHTRKGIFNYSIYMKTAFALNSHEINTILKHYNCLTAWSWVQRSWFPFITRHLYFFKKLFEHR